MSLVGPAMSSLCWIALILAVLVGLAFLGDRKQGPCCEHHAGHNPAVSEIGYCSYRGY
jgi:hypothetical protein